MPSVALRPQDLLVEFRDKSLVRQGSIPIVDLRLKMQPVYNGVGSWLVQLPAEHRAVPYLRAPGAGLIVTNLLTGETLMSGSSSKPSKKTSMNDPKGMVTVAGLSDERLLWDALAYPQPSNSNPATQTVANDVRTAQGSALLRTYVSANIGPTSPVGRRGVSLRNAIILGGDPALGVITTRRPRYDILGDLLNGIAVETGLGFRLVQIGSNLVFQVYQPVDRQATIRLDVQNGTLQEQEVEFAPPEVTRMVVAGQGEGVERQMISVTSAAATTAETDWGLIIEEFKDHRNTDVVAELTAAGVERLNEAGFTKVALKAVPSNDQTMIFLTDFFMGDKVSVVVDGQEQPNSIITEAAIVVDSAGIKTAVAIGDIADFDSDSALRQTLTDTQKRVDNLERNAEGGGSVDWANIINEPTTFPPSAHTHDASAISSGTMADARLPGRLGVNAKTVTDYNTVDESGWTMGSSVANAPSAAWYLVETIRHNTLYAVQTAYAFTSVNAPTYFRQEVNGTWYPWTLQYNSSSEINSLIDAAVLAADPAGVVKEFAGATLPDGHLWADGASYTTASQPRLFAAIGYVHGGSGANFNVPNRKGRVGVGRDAANVKFDVLGEKGGAETHTLTVPEMPNHQHGMFNIGYGEAGGPTLYTVGYGATRASNDLTTTAVGGNGAHNNLQPYIALNYIIKT